MFLRGGIEVRGRNLVAIGLVVGILLAMPSISIAAPMSPERPARIAPEGEYRDVEVDAFRGRAYVTDAATWTEGEPEGVLVFDGDTHEEVARIPIEDPTGIALSPSGQTLAVGSLDGYMRIVDTDTLQVTRSAYFTGEPYTPAYLWDVAFYGEDQLFVSLGSPFITCEGSLLVLALPALTEVSRLSGGPCEIQPWSQVRIDAARGLLYVLAPSYVSRYNLTGPVPTWNATAGAAGFSGRGVLTPDGGRLIFSSGSVYDATSFNLLADAGHLGEVSVDPTGTNAFFAKGPFVDEVQLSDYASTARYVFDGNDMMGPLTVSSAAVDGDRRIAYVITPRGTNANQLHAVPLFPAFVDPFPGNGWVLSRSDFGTGAFFSGGIDAQSVQMAVDGATVSPSFDLQRFWVAYMPASPWLEGTHRIALRGNDPSGIERTLNWSFEVDSQPPRILLDHPEPVYRTPDVTLHGTIVDRTRLNATANSQPLAVDVTTGAFAVTLRLEEGANLLFIEAQDQAFNRNGSVSWILYVPPTNRPVDPAKDFSIEYPANWSYQVDAVVQGVHLDALMSEPFGTSASVLAVNDPANATEQGVRRAAEEVYSSLSNLPGFTPGTPPTPYDVPGLFAFSYSYERGLGSSRVFQRQVLIADTVERHVWVLTFTVSFLGAPRYDPLFRWMASSFRSEGARRSPDTSTVLTYVVGSVLAGVAGALGLAAYVTYRLRSRKAAPPPSLSPLPPEGPASSPPSNQEPPPNQPPPS
jgi:hypothetical protein